MHFGAIQFSVIVSICLPYSTAHFGDMQGGGGMGVGGVTDTRLLPGYDPGSSNSFCLPVKFSQACSIVDIIKCDHITCISIVLQKYACHPTAEHIP